MSIRLTCPTCRTAVSVADNQAGTRVSCPACAHDLPVQSVRTDGSSPPVEHDQTPRATQPNGQQKPLPAPLPEVHPLGSLAIGKSLISMLNSSRPLRIAAVAIVVVVVAMLFQRHRSTRTQEPADNSPSTQTAVRLVSQTEPDEEKRHDRSRTLRSPETTTVSPNDPSRKSRSSESLAISSDDSDFSKVDYSRGPEGQVLSERSGVSHLYNGHKKPTGERVPFYSREQGFDRNGQWVYHGKQVTYWDENMSNKFGEEYRFNGELHGPIKSWDQQGQLRSRGKYVNGKRDGEWLHWHQNGEKKAEEHYRLGKDIGTFIEWSEAGEKLRERVFADGELVSIPYELNVGYEAVGPSKVKVLTEGYRRDGKNFVRHGKLRKLTKIAYQTEEDDPYLLLLEAYFVDGKQQGKSIRYQAEFDTKNGIGVRTGGVTKEEEVEYRDGIRQGSYTLWNRDGKVVIEGQYLDGKKTGTWTYYKADGSLWQTKTFENDQEQR